MVYVEKIPQKSNDGTGNKTEPKEVLADKIKDSFVPSISSLVDFNYIGMLLCIFVNKNMSTKDHVGSNLQI